MFRHHLLLIYRNFRKYKGSFFINLIGLSAGLSCALLIYLWVNDEIQTDRFHAANERLYQVMENETTDQGTTTHDGTSAPLAEALLKEMPEVEQAVSASPTYWLAGSRFQTKGGTPIKASGKFAGRDFFQIFSYPLLSGSAGRVLMARNSIVISENMALKLFHTTDVIGKELSWNNTDMPNENHVIVTGVFKNIPSRSSDQFDFITSLDFLFSTAPNYLKWGNIGPNTFVILKKDTDPRQFNAKILNFMRTKGQEHRQLFIRPFADGYLYGNYENGQQAGGRIEYVKLFSLIAVFILAIACINFMNLSTAKASRRLKEVGIKKVMGAHRTSLIIQYMAESLLLSFISLFIALLCVEVLLPYFNTITGKQLVLQFNPGLVLTAFSIAAFTGLLSGSYPALYLSGFHPSLALKGKLHTSAGELWLRRGLVVFQFSLSIILIVSVLVIYKQIEFVQSKNMGFKKDNVIYFETEGKLKETVDPFLAELRRIPGVVNASSIDRNFLGDLSSTSGDFNWEGKDPKQLIKFQKGSINTGLIETLGMEMAAGRSFSGKFGADSSKILINQAGIKAMGLKDPVGKIFSLWGKDYQIAGIVKDFNFESLHYAVKPMFFRYGEKGTNRIMIRIVAGKEKETLTSIRKFYQAYNPGYALDYKFLDQDFQAQYTAENRVASLSRYFAGLAVIISCLGLFGLAAFTAERRLKEIGIRKVLGASRFNLVYILSRDFTRPVIISILLALPLSYILARYWLNSFAYRMDLQIWYFAAAGLLALFIAWLTVGTQAVKAAAADPVKCLREE